MSIKARPERLSGTFNTSYYFQDGEYIQNTGTQRLRGHLNLESEIVYGDETVYGNSAVGTEPIVLTVTDPNSLQDNQLVTKSYLSTLSTFLPNIYTSGSSVSSTDIADQYINNVMTPSYIGINFTDESIYKPMQSFSLNITCIMTRLFVSTGFVTPVFRVSGLYTVYCQKTKPYFRTGYDSISYMYISGDRIFDNNSFVSPFGQNILLRNLFKLELVDRFPRMSWNQGGYNNSGNGFLASSCHITLSLDSSIPQNNEVFGPIQSPLNTMSGNAYFV